MSSKKHDNVTVSWVMLDEKILKIEELGETYYIDDAVVKFMEAKQLTDKEDFKVNIEVDDEAKPDDTAGTIKKIIPVGVGEEKTETVEEPTNTDNEIEHEEKQLTIAGVSVKNKGVIFKEEEKVWYTLSDNLSPEDIKACQGKKVNVKIEKTSKGNDIVHLVAVLEQTTSEQQKTTDNPPKPTLNDYQVNTQKSIESQVACEHAQILAGTLATCGVLKTVEEINTFVDSRAKLNYSLMQEVKYK